MAALAVLLLLPAADAVRWAVGGALVLLWAISLVWGASFIGSQMFVQAVCRGKKEGMRVALTFDDGPDPVMSEQILGILDQHRCKASFFLIGKKLQENAGMVMKMAEAGHTIGTHSFSHSCFFPVRSGRRVKEEILASNHLAKEITGREVRFFRPPFGVTNPRIYRGLKGTGMLVAGWSIRSLDTRGEAARRVVRRILRKAGPGDIILLHETSPRILEILEILLPSLREKGLSSTSLEMLLEQN